jgi:hypothetical protein
MMVNNHKAENAFLILCKNFHSVNLHYGTLSFSFWELHVIKMFIHGFVIYVHYMLRIVIKCLGNGKH